MHEELECEQLLQESVDLRNIVTKFAYTHFQSEEDELQAAKEVFTSAFENSNSGKLQKFEHWLNAKDDNLVKKMFLFKQKNELELDLDIGNINLNEYKKEEVSLNRKLKRLDLEK